MIDEGYIKFSINQVLGETPMHGDLIVLNEARTELHKLGFIGITKDGIGFGNVSIRDKKNEFIITGSATGKDEVLSYEEYTKVTDFNLKNNSVRSEGPVKASSESMTHGAIYKVNSKVNCVIHIHSRVLFDIMRKNNWAETPESAKFGTPELAFAISELVKESGENLGVFVTAGHDEGIIAYGKSVDETLGLILNLVKEFGE